MGGFVALSTLDVLMTLGAYMDRLLQVMGVILIVMGVWNIRSDWLTFVTSSALGVSFLIAPYGSRSRKLQGLRKTLLLVTFVLAIMRLITFL